MRKDLDYYTKQLTIDKHQLDDCIEKQSGLFNEIAIEVANAISERDFLKKDYEEIQAGVAADLRFDAKERSAKITDKAVMEAVGEHDDVRQAYSQFLESKKNVDLWTALKESFLQRSYMIKELAQLYIAGYFADKSFASAEVVVEEVKVDDARKSATGKRRPLKRRGK